MKKLIALLLALVMVCCLFACSNDKNSNNTTEATNNTKETTAPSQIKGTMTYAEYVAAELETEVTVACYVQAAQSWWNDKITVYAADADGAYFLYEMACSKEDAAKLTPGTLIKVTGTKSAWAGEVEIVDATFAFVEGGDTYIAGAKDLTGLLGSEELINYQNQAATFTGMTVKGISFKNEGGDDIYVTLTKGGKDYSFCVEVYLTGTSSEVYTAVSALKAGDIVDVDCFLYWYEGMNPHIVGIQKAQTMTYNEYVAAELETEVAVACYVQATQSWWDNKITVYAADADGAYFLYELACSKEDAAKLTPGTLIKVTGTKSAWAGEVEIVDATFTFVEGAGKFVVEAIDLTDKLGSYEIINYQNQLATFKGMTVKELSFKNEGGDDIYVTLTKDGKDYKFCVEVYLTGTETDLYKAVAALEAGKVVDVECFLYWYEGMNPHITAITVQ